MVLYDVSNRHSFKQVEKWIEEVYTHIHFSDIVVMIVGCKAELVSILEIILS